MALVGAKTHTTPKPRRGAQRRTAEIFDCKGLMKLGSFQKDIIEHLFPHNRFQDESLS